MKSFRNVLIYKSNKTASRLREIDYMSWIKKKKEKSKWSPGKRDFIYSPRDNSITQYRIALNQLFQLGNKGKK